MTQYKNIAAAWLNESKTGKGKYLAIKNTGIDPITIEPGKSFYMNMTPKDVRAKNENVPLFSKSIKVTDDKEVDNF